MDTQLAVTIGCLRDEGLTFVCRYYDDSGNRSAKCMDRAEVDALHAAGLQIFSVYETCAGLCTGGCTGSPCGVEYFTQAQGEYDGRAALEAARSAGQPKVTPIYFAIDYDAGFDELDVITDYFSGINDVLAGEYSIGVYGSYRVCEFARDRWPAVSHRWQTYAWSRGERLVEVD